MKANEAPEKINVLLYEEPLSTGYIGSAWVGKPIGLKGETEYIRTDAFIEKALAFIRNCTTYNGLGYKAKCVNIEEFRKYMKGE